MITNSLRGVLIAGMLLTTLLGASPSSAGLFRAYLASQDLGGNESNSCSVDLPCRLLAAALAAVNDGGEIWMLDSANFNVAPVNITKSITILAIPGALGSIVANGGDALDIATPNVR